MTRNTRQKEAILKALRGQRGHADAHWIYEKVRLKMPRISLGTVYRDLKALTAEEQISEIYDGHESRFDAVPGSHYHFRCTECGEIQNLAGKPDGEMDGRASAKYHLKISHHRLDFYGLCPACERKKTQER